MGEKEIEIDVEETIKGVLELLERRRKDLERQIEQSENELEKNLLMAHLNEVSNIEEEIRRLWKLGSASEMEGG